MNGIATGAGLVLSVITGSYQYKRLRSFGYSPIDAVTIVTTGYSPRDKDWKPERLIPLYAPAAVGFGIHKVAVATNYNRSTPKGVNL